MVARGWGRSKATKFQLCKKEVEKDNFEVMGMLISFIVVTVVTVYMYIKTSHVCLEYIQFLFVTLIK